MKITRPVLKPYDKDRFELVEDYTRGMLTIPKGYKTNGANIPRIFWSIFPPNSPEYLSAVVVHDYLCEQAVKSPTAWRRGIAKERSISARCEATETIERSEVGADSAAVITFKLADEVLKQMMMALGVAKWKANLFYYACRLYHKIKYGE